MRCCLLFTLSTIMRKWLIEANENAQLESRTITTQWRFRSWGTSCQLDEDRDFTRFHADDDESRQKFRYFWSGYSTEQQRSARLQVKRTLQSSRTKHNAMVGNLIKKKRDCELVAVRHTRWNMDNVDRATKQRPTTSGLIWSNCSGRLFCLCCWGMLRGVALTVWEEEFEN